jgi:DNA-binding XRE family transcriptional regulator
VSALNNLLDKYKEKCQLKTDSAIASSLGISRQSVFQWRKGMAWPSDENVLTMAEKIGATPEEWFVSIHAERTSPEARKVWLRLASRLATAAAIAVIFSRLDVHCGGVHAACLAFSNVYYVKL